MSTPEPATRRADPARVFAALGDRTRLSLLDRLSEGRASSISSLCANSHLTRQAVTKHLHVLQNAGLVASQRIGRESRYVYRPESIAEARSYLDGVAAQWDGALERLRAFVED
jgi:DNA-binding transcriptional ArsR family regulator